MNHWELSATATESVDQDSVAADITRFLCIQDNDGNKILIDDEDAVLNCVNEAICNAKLEVLSERQARRLRRNADE